MDTQEQNALLCKTYDYEKFAHPQLKLQNNNHDFSTEISLGEAATPIAIQNNGIFERWPEKRTNPKDATSMARRQDSNSNDLLKA